MSFRNVYLCVWIGTWMRGILYQKRPSPGYRENIQQEEVLVKILQRNWSFSTNLSCRASLSLSSQVIITLGLTFIILFLLIYVYGNVSSNSTFE